MSFTFGIKSLFSPNDDVKAEILKEVGDAKTSILMMIYGFTLPDLTDLLIAKHQAGVQVQCVMDLSQSKGNVEKVQVQRLKDAGIDITIGTSPTAHAIMHEKGICIDSYRTMTGSYNFSTGAKNQVNHMDFIASIDRATWFTTFFNEIRTWMRQNEKQVGGDINAK
jgi:phosphatidylserine/phosphatidylglycerophosphate/cardiolipin synthase-like enzyme